MPKSFFLRLLIWTAICCISAAPSFYWAVQEFRHREQILAMLLGIAIFILAYTFITGTAYVRRLNEQPLIRRTAIIGYATRVGISIAFPIALALDFACGIVSAFIIGFLFGGLPGGTDTFAAILAWTLVQGVVLNLVLLFYMSAVYSFLKQFHAVPKGTCGKCGYDLRASVGRCPECGEPFKAK